MCWLAERHGFAEPRLQRKIDFGYNIAQKSHEALKTFCHYQADGVKVARQRLSFHAPELPAAEASESSTSPNKRIRDG
jgi:hypothetical protein